MCLSKYNVYTVISHCYNIYEPVSPFFKKENSNGKKKALYMFTFLGKENLAWRPTVDKI